MAPAKTRKRKSDQDAVSQSQEASQVLTVTTPKRQKHLPVRPKGGDSPATDSPVPADGSAKGTMITFGDDDVAQPALILSTSASKAPVATTAEDEESGDSDDEAAPEAVSTQQAASQVRKSAQTAQKVAQEYVAFPGSLWLSDTDPFQASSGAKA